MLAYLLIKNNVDKRIRTAIKHVTQRCQYEPFYLPPGKNNRKNPEHDPRERVKHRDQAELHCIRQFLTSSFTLVPSFHIRSDILRSTADCVENLEFSVS